MVLLHWDSTWLSGQREKSQAFTHKSLVEGRWVGGPFSLQHLGLAVPVEQATASGSPQTIGPWVLHTGLGEMGRYQEPSA